METSSLAQRLTSRFVAGQTLDQGVAVCKRLNADGYLASLDHLGEAVTSAADACEARDAYLLALDRIAAEELQATVSIKLSQFGIEVSASEARENIRLVVEKAKAAGIGIEIDMEESATVDRTLEIVSELHQRYGNVRSVIQAYLRRSEVDVERLCGQKVPIRLCKGAYNEPPATAFPLKKDVDRNYLRLAAILMKRGTNPAIATHDPRMIRGALTAAEDAGLGRGQFEFQMLYGIRRDVQRNLIEEGYKLRLYVPYGSAWYPYFMRRLAERPANLLFLARSLTRR